MSCVMYFQDNGIPIFGISKENKNWPKTVSSRSKDKVIVFN